VSLPEVLRASQLSFAEGAARSGFGTGSGRGALEVIAHRGRTALASLRAESPLRLLTPKNHGLGVWAFVSSLGGGLVGGDAIELDVRVHEGATLYLGTQASTKVYKGRRSRQSTTAHVEAGGLLVLFPDPVVPFAGSSFEQSTRVLLARGASAIVLDAFTAGRAACGERYRFARFATRTAIDTDGVPVVRDAVVLDPTHGPLGARMGRFDAFATMTAVGPRAAAIAADMLADATGGALATTPSGRSSRTLPDARTASRLSSVHRVDGGAVMRVASTTVEEMVVTVRKHARSIATVLGDDPFARKW
jgi:urease accessory protein